MDSRQPCLSITFPVALYVVAAKVVGLALLPSILMNNNSRSLSSSPSSRRRHINCSPPEPMPSSVAGSQLIDTSVHQLIAFDLFLFSAVSEICSAAP